MAADAEGALISKVLHTGGISGPIEAGVSSKHFHDPDHGDVWDWMANHYLEYQVSPSLAALRDRFPDYRLTKVPEPLEYYVDRLFAHHKRQSTFNLVLEASELIKAEDADGALATMADGLYEISTSTSKTRDEDIVSTWEERFERYRAIEENKGELVGIPTGFPSFDKITGGYQPEQLVTWIGPQKAGKAQPLWESVLTPVGWRKMGDLTVGDAVIGRDGRPTAIIDIPYQGERQVYRVTFSDGSHAHACAEHLWTIEPRDSVQRTVDTSQLAELCASRRRQDVYFPMVAPVQFEASGDRPVDPYLLGLLIGDGSFRTGSLTYTTIDPELLEQVRQRVPAGLLVKPIGRYGYRIVGRKGRANPLIDQLRSLGLWGHTTLEKFIPPSYLLASVEDRLAVLRGLMDTDGGMEGKSAYFTTSSPRLASDFKELVRSLGGIVSTTTKLPSYGKGKVGARCYRFAVRLPAELGCPFGYGPKVARWANGCVKRLPIRTVTAVEMMGVEEVRCITVSNADGLYVTNDYIVTHNSSMLLKSAIAANDAGYKVLVAGFEMSNEEQGARYDGMRAGFNYNHMLNGTMTKHDWRALRAAGERQAGNPEMIFVHDPTSTTTMTAVSAKVRQYAPDIVFIDGVYLMDSEIPGVEPTDTKSLTKISRSCKRLAQSLKIPVVISTQALDWKWNPKHGLTARSVGYTSAFGQDSDWLFGVEPADDEGMSKVRLIVGRRYSRQLVMVRFDWDEGDISEVEGWSGGDDEDDEYGSERERIA